MKIKHQNTNFNVYCKNKNFWNLNEKKTESLY